MNYDGFSFQPQGNVKYPAKDAPNIEGILIDRSKDTEYKMINELANQLAAPNPNIVGKLKLFTENDTCGSYNDIIFNFSKDFPGITIEVIHNDGAKTPKK
jgi:hypothetical protein